MTLDVLHLWSLIGIVMPFGSCFVGIIRLKLIAGNGPAGMHMELYKTIVIGAAIEFLEGLHHLL